MLAGFSAVAVGDILVALYFRSLADRVDSGEAISTNIEPDKARRFATMMLVAAPLMWLLMALVSFGLIPTTIDPIQF